MDLAQKTRILGTISYLLIILGSCGMVVFATKFSLASSPWQLKLTKERFLGLNGYQVWIVSWFSIILGTSLQLIILWVF